jgi:hypothetical protein
LSARDFAGCLKNPNINITSKEELILQTSYYSHGSLTGTVIRFDKFSGHGLLDADGYWYKVFVKRANHALKCAFYHKAKENRPITIKFWPTLPFPELLSNPIILKVNRFTEAREVDYVTIHGIIHESSPPRCVIRIPSLMREKDYYSLVTTQTKFEPGVAVCVQGVLESGKIIAKTISKSD